MAGNCGCFGECDCALTGSGLAIVTGTGDVTDPYNVHVDETTFDLTSLSQALIVTPGGTSGHEPSIDLLVDPASTAPVSVGVGGLKIDCCPAQAPELDPAVCNEATDTGSGLYVDSGFTSVTPGTATAVGVQAPGGSSPDSWARNITNNEACDMLVRVGGNPFVDVEIQSDGVASELEVAARLEIASAHTFVGGGTQRAHRFNESVPTVLANVGELYSFGAKLDDHVILPAGETLEIHSYLATTKRANFDGTTASGNGYTFQTPYILVAPMRRTDLDVTGAAP